MDRLSHRPDTNAGLISKQHSSVTSSNKSQFRALLWQGRRKCPDPPVQFIIPGDGERGHSTTQNLDTGSYDKDAGPRIWWRTDLHRRLWHEAARALWQRVVAGQGPGNLSASAYRALVSGNLRKRQKRQECIYVNTYTHVFMYFCIYHWYNCILFVYYII